jgi:hypothetical protein
LGTGGVSSDAGLCAAVYLDLTGVIPTAGRRRFWRTTRQANAQLIDGCCPARRSSATTLTLDDADRRRRADKLAKPWLAYLYESVAASRSANGSRADFRGRRRGDKLDWRFFLNRDGSRTW